MHLIEDLEESIMHPVVGHTTTDVVISGEVIIPSSFQRLFLLSSNAPLTILEHFD